MHLEPDEHIDALAKAVIGAAIEVHRVLGPGYLESLYEQALGIELDGLGIPFERQKTTAVCYKGRLIGEGRLDFLVDGRLIVELKASDGIAPIHVAQVISYLKALQLPLGILINFNARLLKNGGIKRVVLSDHLGDLGG